MNSASSATSSKQHQTVPLLIIPTPGGGTKLQPLTPEVMSSTGLVVNPMTAPRISPIPAPPVTSMSPAPSAIPKCDPAASSSDGDGTNSLVNLDYVINDSDGSCMCKMCGEVLSSRTHWYRHKYKVIHYMICLSESVMQASHLVWGLENACTLHLMWSMINQYVLSLLCSVLLAGAGYITFTLRFFPTCPC